MSARPMASATVSFGLVSVPVKLYSAAESSARVSFNWINKDTGHRVKQRYYDPHTNEEVDREDMVKGYEFSKGHYVLFTPEELKALEQQSTNTIDITEFVPMEEVDRRFLDKVYYLGPDKGGDRAYKLLSAALKKTGRAAVATYAARGKQYLVLVRPMDDGLVMEQLHYPDELRDFSEVPQGEGEVKKEELALAVQLIEQAASEEFDPGQYSDEVRQRVMDLIQQKIDGEDITAAPAEEPQAQIIDLMEALKASVAKTDEDTGRKPAKRAAAKSSSKKTSRKRKTGS
jgi:DNA end-binding protein Ku